MSDLSNLLSSATSPTDAQTLPRWPPATPVGSAGMLARASAASRARPCSNYSAAKKSGKNTNMA